MNTLDLLDLLRRKDVKIWEEGEHVHINAPKGTLTPDLQAHIRECKQELVRLLRETPRMDSRVGPPIHPSSRADPLPLSFAQERLWFFDKFQPGNPAYNISSAFSVSGHLNIMAMEQALGELVRRHEVLRTTFPLLENRPIQKISSDLEIMMDVRDYRHLSEPERGEVTRRILEQEARTTFQLAEGPLWRFTVVRQGDSHWVLMFVIHHILADAWSLDVFLRELLSLYQGIGENRPSRLPQLSVQYGDFARWQRQDSVQQFWDHQLEYWKKHLFGCPMFLDLPCDWSRPSDQSFTGGQVSFTISKELTDALSEVGRGERATIFMTLLAAFQTLLFRYAGQEEFLVGVPVAGRNKEEVKSTIGLFVNTVVIRANLSGSPSFTELVAQVRRVALEAFANQELPFEQVVTAVHPDRTLSHHPLFQVMFAYHNFSRDEGAVLDNIPGLHIEPMSLETQTAKFDLTVLMAESSHGLSGAIEYRTDLFRKETIQRMAGHFETLLQGIVANPHQCVSSLPLLTPRERYQVLEEWNTTKQAYPNRCLHELIEEQAVKTPDAPAVIFKNSHLTYDELNQRANRVANFLRKAGVGPEVFVGIYLNRSIDLMVALLGVLKAGGAYIPLDVSLPRERFRLIMEESHMLVLLTETEFMKKIPSPFSSSQSDSPLNGEGGAIDGFELEHRWPRVMCLDAQVAELEQEPTDNVCNLTTPDNLAYVIYTSGSTGIPKGVMVPHRGLVNYLNWFTKTYDVKGGGGALVHSSIGFDMAVTSLFAPLIVGKPVELLPPDASIDVLANALVNQPAWSFLKLTPSHMDMLSYRLPGRKQYVKRVIVGGEALQGHTIHTWRSLDPDAKVVNEYGPTEAVVGCCVYEVPSHEESSGSLPIGRPISNVQLYILDPCQQPVPIGVQGELYIGGEGLARGYLNQPDLTRQRFITNPFEDAPNSYLFKTGDRCRYRDEGTIEFLGRFDRQVKLRGFRIELAEVEAVLSRHPAVRESVAVLKEQSGFPMLVAYIVPSASCKNSNDDPAWNEASNFSELSALLQAFLQDWLPSYMIPSSFLILDALPLTSNGKIDYEGLPALESEVPQFKDSIVLPRDRLEAQLVTLWEVALGVKPICVYDNFFNLGGHSLLAVQLWARMESLVGKALPLSLLYRSPTIAQLAQIIRQQGESTEWEYLMEVQPKGHHKPLFIVPGAGDAGLYLRELAKYLGSDQPLCGFHAQGLDGKKPFHASVNEMARHYVKELCLLQPEGPYFLGGYSFGGMVAYEMAQHLQHAGQQVALLALFDTPGPGYRRPSATERKVESFCDRIGRHGQNLSTLNWEHRSEYVWERFESLLNSLSSRLIRTAARWVCYAWRVLNLPIPLALRRYYMLYVTSEEAKAAYQVGPFAGPVTLFQADGPSSTEEGLGWKEYSLGGLEIKHLAGTHSDLLKEPYVKGLAKNLRDCMEKARLNVR